MSEAVAVMDVLASSPAPGAPALNRVRIRGTLVARSPVRVGSGEARFENREGGTEEVAIDEVEVDATGRLVIPGSSLRGVIRHHLHAAAGAKLVERLFGPDIGTTQKSLVSGKVCFDDAPATVSGAGRQCRPFSPRGWDSRRGTYVVTSVRIDPETGSAAEHLLYKFEVAPVGTRFGVSIVASNLLDEELGLLLLGLQSLDQSRAQATVGASAGRGFGRFDWCVNEVAVLGIRATSKTDRSSSAFAQQRINRWKSVLESMAPSSVAPDGTLLRSVGGAVLGTTELDALVDTARTFTSPSSADITLVVPYTLLLRTDLVIRAGTDPFRLGRPQEGGGAQTAEERQGQAAKKRGERFDIRLPGAGGSGAESDIASPAFQVVLDDGGEPHLRFDIPGSALRGTLRGFLDRHRGSHGGADPLVSAESFDALFGTVKQRGRIEFEHAVPCGDRGLLVRYEDHERQLAAKGGPANPKFRVKVRGPVDRLTGGAKKGGLHQMLAAEAGSRFEGQIVIRRAASADLRLVGLWRDLLATGQLTLGGVTSAGNGLATATLGEMKLLDVNGEVIVDPARRDAYLSQLAAPLTPASAAIAETATSTPVATVTAVTDAASIEPPAGAQSKPYYMNPYDFVPFPRADDGRYIEPKRATLAEWEALAGDEPLLSGTLTVELEALQPVHIVGRSSPQPPQYRFAFHRSGGSPVIPGSSLRGLLRAFIEARWNGWVSTYTRNLDTYEEAYARGVGAIDLGRNPYMKQFTTRYIGFNTDTAWRNMSGRGKLKSLIPQALPAPFVPAAVDALAMSARPLDLATFLFGAVLFSRPGDHEVGQSPALRGRIRVTDAVLRCDQLSWDFYVPDLADEKRPGQPAAAFLGDPKPSKSSMFYFRPYKIQHRKAGGRFNVAQFLAGDFRGRKFYFHQDWQSCVQTYLEPGPGSENAWARGRQVRQVMPRHLESVRPGERTTFTVGFERIPRPMVRLLLAAIENPGTLVRHKLGYAKPMGFGSISCHVTSIDLYRLRAGERGLVVEQESLPVAALRSEVEQENTTGWPWACEPGAFAQSDAWVRYILTYPANETSLKQHLFAYPGYRQRAKDEDPVDAMTAGFAVPNEPRVVGLADGKRGEVDVEASSVYYDRGIKYTLDLGLWQRGSQHFAGVCHRAQREGETLVKLIHPEAR